MKAEDIDAAKGIADARRVNLRLRERLAAHEKLSLLIGDGNEASAIVLMPSYLMRIRTDLIGAIDARIAENEAALRALGVDP